MQTQKKQKNINPTFINYAKNWLKSSKQVNTRSKVKSIIIALILGLIVSFAIMSFTSKQNPISVFTTMVRVAFGNNMLDYTLALSGLLLIAGLANGIAFKTGLFNIGVSGQMFFAGTITVLLGLTTFKSLGILGLVILIWIGAISGGIIAGFIGWLKAKFNVNEVVTSILLNWGLFYIARYIIVILPKSMKILDNSGATNVLPPEFQISAHYYGAIILMIGLVIALIISILLWKSTFGHALKISGLSINGAKYAGLNVNKQIIMAMGFSGLISGILGVSFFVIQEKQIGTQYLSFNELPTLGFEGIAIALLAYSNPIGIIPIAFIFGILKSGSGGLVEYNIDNSFSNLIIGIMMYFSAISILFMQFKPITLVYTWCKINKKHFPKQYSQIKQKYKMMLENYIDKSSSNKLVWEKEIQILQKEMISKTSKYNLAKKNKEDNFKLKNLKREIDDLLTQIKNYQRDIKNIKKGFKNIKKYKKTQIKLFKLEKQQDFFNRTHKILVLKGEGGK